MIETIFGAVLVVGCLAFVVFLWKMSRTSETPKVKQKKTKKRKTKTKHEQETREVDGVPIPKEWRESENPGPTPTPSLFKETGTQKIRVPGLRMVKRVIAALLLIINFLIAQATLMSAPATQPLYLLFGLNAFILLDYLWKTRRKQTI